MGIDVWTAPADATQLGDELVGFEVEGRDGSIGKVDHVSYEGTCLIVSTARLFGHKYVVPVRAVDRIDADDGVVYVDLTKAEVEGSPEYDEHLGFDEDCEGKTGAYYADLLADRTGVR